MPPWITLVVLFLWWGPVYAQAQGSTPCPTSCRCQTQSWSTKAVCQGGDLAMIVGSISATNINHLTIIQATNSRHLTTNMFRAENNVRQLTHLVLSRSSIQQVDDDTFLQLSGLMELNLGQNSIGQLSDNALNGLGRVQTLNMSWNSIRHLGKSLASLTQLRMLDLSHNSLGDIPAGTFQTQTDLVSLILDNNRLVNLHGYVFQGLSNLRMLSLRNCDISILPSDFFSIIRNVNALNLGNNRITTLPTYQDFRNLPSLRQLILDGNAISTLTDQQFSGISLDKMDLSKNRLQTLSSTAFSHFNVRNLDLSFNRIREIDTIALKPMAPQLERLNLASNHFRSVPQQVFDGLYRLQALNLSGCGLEELEDEQFKYLQSLKILDISGNSLKHLSSGVISHFNNLEMLSVDRNKWHCDCHIKPLRTWLRDHDHSHIVYCHEALSNYADCNLLSKCFSPQQLAMKSIVTLKDVDIVTCDEESGEHRLPLDATIGILVACVIVTMITIGLSVFFWRRNRHRQHRGFAFCNSDRSEVSSHEADKERKEKPLQDIDIAESDRGFVVRNYFHSMVQEPSIASRGSPELSRKFYGSQTSITSSQCSYPMGIESAV